MKTDDTSMDDMNLSVVHVICNQCSILPNKENQILFWVSYNHSVVRITKLRTNVNIVLSKTTHACSQHASIPFISTIVFKYPHWKLGHIVNIGTTQTQVTLSLMDGHFSTKWFRNCPPCLSLHTHSNYHSVVKHMHKTIKKKHFSILNIV